MQKNTKRILGAAGLATVAGMTVVAQGIQAPAYAQTTTSDVQLKVVVQARTPDVEIEGPLQDGGATSLSTVTIPLNISHGTSLTYTLSARQGNLKAENVFDPVTIQLADASSAEGFSGVKNVELALEEYQKQLVASGFSADKDIEFTFSAKLTGPSGITDIDGMVFTYGVITIDPNTNIDDNAPADETNTAEKGENGDPIINVETGDEVENVHVVIRDPETGKIIWEGDFPAGTDVTKITLPFVENNIGSGNYIIEVTALDKDGKVVGTSNLDIRYVATVTPVVPGEETTDLGLPNTGGVSIAGLNISRADFLLSSAVAFFLVAGGGIYLLHRKQTRK